MKSIIIALCFFMINNLIEAKEIVKFTTTSDAFFFNGKKCWAFGDSIVQYDLESNLIQRIKVSDYRGTELVSINSNGIFYQHQKLVGGGLVTSLNFLSNDFKILIELGQFKVFLKSQYNSSLNDTICFYGETLDGKSGLFECNLASTNAILSKSFKINNYRHIYFFNKNIISLSNSNNEINIFLNGDILKISNNKIYSNFSFSEVKNNKIFFLLYNKQTNLQDLYVFNDDLKLNELKANLVDLEIIHAKTDMIYFASKISNNYYLMGIQDKNIKLLKKDPKLSNYNLFIESWHENNVLLIKHATHGREFAKIYSDSIVLDDYQKGPLGGVYNSFYQNDTLYAWMSNGFDGYVYLNKINSNNLSSIYKKASNFYTNFYFYKDKIFSVDIERIDANSLRYKLVSDDLTFDIKQPPKNSKTDSFWLKTFTVLNNNPYFSESIYGNVLNLNINRNDDIFVHMYSDSRAVIMPNDTFQFYKTISNNIIKLDKYGNVKWFIDIGGFHAGSHTFSSYHRQVLDSKGNLIVVGYVFLNGRIGEDSILYYNQNERVKFFICKINGESGEIIWHRILNKTEFSEQYLDEITIDKNANLYITFLERKNQNTFDNYLLQSGVTPFNVIAKYDSLGKLLYMKNVKNNWTNTFGRTKFIGINPNNNQIVMQQSQGEHYFNGICNSRNWENKTFFMKGGNEANIVANLFSTDLSWIRSSCIDNKGSIHTFGFWRSKLSINGNFNELTTPKNRDCHDYNVFYTLTNPSLGIVTKVLINRSAYFQPISTKYLNNFIYLLASFEGKVHLIKFDINGEYVGYKNLEFRYGGYSGNIGISFDVMNGTIVIGGYRFHSSIQYNVPPNTDAEWFNVIKIKDEDWQKDKEWFEEESNISSKNKKHNIFIYPNPTNEILNIVFDELNNYNQYQILNIEGKNIKSGEFNYSKPSIDVSSLSGGVYILRIFSNEQTETVKFIKI